MKLSKLEWARPQELLDPYVYFGTNVLINNLNIRDNILLGDMEYVFANKAIAKGITTGNFDLDHLKNIHKELFGELYSWAGQIRTVDITKGDSTFCRNDFIENEVNKLLKKLVIKDNFLKTYKNDKVTFVDIFADYFCEINVIHPFREGNGRTIRIFFEQLAHLNGFKLDLTGISKDQWIQASIDGFNCNNAKLVAIFHRALDLK